MAAYQISDAVANGDGDRLFDVTCVIGSVYSGGSLPPEHVAFLLIAEHGDGIYTFPLAGSTVTVEVSGISGPPKVAAEQQNKKAF